MHEISPQELKQQLADNKDVLLIDIREEWEREAYNIGGLHIPMGDIPARLNEIPKSREVILYCEKGIRSVIAIQRLQTIGYDNLYNLSGGMKAWKAAL